MKKIVQVSYKDENGKYVAAPAIEKEIADLTGAATLDLMLEINLKTMLRLTKQLEESAKKSALTKDEAQTLFNLTRTLLELKVKENEALSNLTNEELEERAKANSSSRS